MATSLTTDAARTLATTTRPGRTRRRPLRGTCSGDHGVEGTARRRLPAHRHAPPDHRPPGQLPTEGVVVWPATCVGEPEIPGMYVEYGHPPREYELAAAQTIMRVHPPGRRPLQRPARPTTSSGRSTSTPFAERKELDIARELLEAPPDPSPPHPEPGPADPARLDDLICKQDVPALPAFGHPRHRGVQRGCSRSGIQPSEVEHRGRRVLGWRGLPFLPCDKLPIAPDHTTEHPRRPPGEGRQGRGGPAPGRDPGGPRTRHLGEGRHQLSGERVLRRGRPDPERRLRARRRAGSAVIRRTEHPRHPVLSPGECRSRRERT